MAKIALFCPAYGTQIGTGHLKRCLSLAYYFNNIGLTPVFCGDFNNIPYKTTNSPVQGQVLTIIDDYSQDAGSHKKYDGKIMVIDDLANRPLYCDFLLDYNYKTVDQTSLYQSCLQKSTLESFFGLTYCPLNYQFFEAKKNLSSDYCLIFMTGGNCHRATILAIEGAIMANQKHIKCVIGNLNPHRKEIEVLCANYNINLLIDTNDMPNLIAGATVCIGSFGTNTWERIFLQKKTIGLVLANNQEQIAQNLQDQHLAINLGWYYNVTPADIANAINYTRDINLQLLNLASGQISCDVTQMVQKIVNYV